jgi:hypothetical protein
MDGASPVIFVQQAVHLPAMMLGDIARIADGSILNHPL